MAQDFKVPWYRFVLLLRSTRHLWLSLPATTMFVCGVVVSYGLISVMHWASADDSFARADLVSIPKAMDRALEQQLSENQADISDALKYHAATVDLQNYNPPLKEDWIENERLKFRELIAQDHAWPPLKFLTLPKSPAWCNGSTEISGAVVTGPGKHKLRELIRNRYQLQTGGRIKPLFFLGALARDKEISGKKMTPPQYLEALARENDVYDDLVVADFPEAYQHLPIKTAAILQYSSSCPGLQFLVKHDGDVIVNWATLVEHIKTWREAKMVNATLNVDQSHPTTDLYMGFKWVGMPVIHDVSHRNYENLTEDYFPPYCSGPAYVLGRDRCVLLFKQRLLEPYAHNNEDAMLGLLSAAAGKLEVTHDNGFIPFPNPGYRQPACGQGTNTIAECQCRWVSYHVGESGTENNIAIDASLACRLRHPTWVNIDAPLLSERESKIDIA